MFYNIIEYFDFLRERDLNIFKYVSYRNFCNWFFKVRKYFVGLERGFSGLMNFSLDFLY